MNEELYYARREVERQYEWMKWVEEIPFIPFKEDWVVKVIPPFTGAVVRFLVKKKSDSDENRISVYLDCYEELGVFGEPYWEICPHTDDVYRVKMNNIDELVSEIENALTQI